MPASSRRHRVLFATSNRGKLEEARKILSGLGVAIEQFDGKGTEIQADTTAEVAAYASRGASKAARQAVLVEDAGLFVSSLGGFPGVYSAYALKTIGPSGVIRLLPKGAGREARFVSSVAYCEPGGEPTLFEGTVEGTIARSPKGDAGFGFDPIFIPLDAKRTFGELSIEEKCRVSHRAKAMEKFAQWFLARDPA